MVAGYELIPIIAIAKDLKLPNKVKFHSYKEILHIFEKWMEFFQSSPTIEGYIRCFN